MKFLNRYTFFARYMPGLISILPVTFIYFFLTKRYSDYELKEYVETVSFFLGISGTLLLTFFIAMVVREFGSVMEKRYFANRSDFPTNYLMLYQNTKMPKQIKDKYRRKILTDFDVSLANESEEIVNEAEAIKLLGQASRLLATRYQQQSQVKDANIAYGFARNVSGGLLLSVPTSVIGLAMGIVLKENALLLWSSVLLFVFVMLLVFHKSWIKSNAEKYAEKLFSVYLSDK